MATFVWDKVCEIGLLHEIYPISFSNKFNFVNNINRNSSQIINALKIFKMQESLGMNQLKRFMTNKLNMIIHT